MRPYILALALVAAACDNGGEDGIVSEPTTPTATLDVAPPEVDTGWPETEDEEDTDSDSDTESETKRRR